MATQYKRESRKKTIKLSDTQKPLWANLWMKYKIYILIFRKKCQFFSYYTGLKFIVCVFSSAKINGLSLQPTLNLWKQTVCGFSFIFLQFWCVSLNATFLENRKDFICGYKPVIEYLNSLISLEYSEVMTYMENIQNNIPVEYEDKISLISTLMRYRLLPINPENKQSCRFFHYLCLPNSQPDAIYNLSVNYLQEHRKGPEFCHIHYHGEETRFPLLSEECLMAIAKRIQAIPVPLAVTQGGVESAWGTSRFSTAGNNFYGIQTTFSSATKAQNNPRCIPAKRNPRRCIYKFNTIEMNYFIYAQTLNSSRAYIALRNYRHQSLLNEDTPCETALKMSEGLSNYAEDPNYLPKVQSTIKKVCQIIDNC